MATNHVNHGQNNSMNSTSNNNNNNNNTTTSGVASGDPPKRKKKSKGNGNGNPKKKSKDKNKKVKLSPKAKAKASRRVRFPNNNRHLTIVKPTVPLAQYYREIINTNTLLRRAEAAKEVHSVQNAEENKKLNSEMPYTLRKVPHSEISDDHLRAVLEAKAPEKKQAKANAKKARYQELVNTNRIRTRQKQEALSEVFTELKEKAAAQKAAQEEATRQASQTKHNLVPFSIN